jgi:hypothetical protein
MISHLPWSSLPTAADPIACRARVEMTPMTVIIWIS